MLTFVVHNAIKMRLTCKLIHQEKENNKRRMGNYYSKKQKITSYISQWNKDTSFSQLTSNIRQNP